MCSSVGHICSYVGQCFLILGKYVIMLGTCAVHISCEVYMDGLSCYPISANIKDATA